MYEIIKQVIQSGDYELSDMINKIKKNCIRGDITDEQETELIAMARENADPTNSYAGIQARIDEIQKTMDELKISVNDNTKNIQAIKDKLEEGGTVVPEPEPEPEPEEYPEYVQPTGAHDAYHKDDKITFNGEKYICIAGDGIAVVWSPDEYPDYWQKVSEMAYLP